MEKEKTLKDIVDECQIMMQQAVECKPDGEVMSIYLLETIKNIGEYVSEKTIEFLRLRGVDGEKDCIKEVDPEPTWDMNELECTGWNTACYEFDSRIEKWRGLKIKDE